MIRLRLQIDGRSEQNQAATSAAANPAEAGRARVRRAPAQDREKTCLGTPDRSPVAVLARAEGDAPDRTNAGLPAGRGLVQFCMRSGQPCASGSGRERSRSRKDQKRRKKKEVTR